MEILAIDFKNNASNDLFKQLKNNGLKIAFAENAKEAMTNLEGNEKISLVFLNDEIGSSEKNRFLELIKQNSKTNQIPIVVNNASNDNDNIAENLRANVKLFIQKQFSDEVILSMFNNIVNDLQSRKSLEEDINHYQTAIKNATLCNFKFKKLDEAQAVANIVAQICPIPEMALLSLTELMVNAVEHGNLGITYKEKSKFLRDDTWFKEIARRTELPENKDKYVSVNVKNLKSELICHIKDCGKGFDWQKYIELNDHSTEEIHGRGIALANAISADKIEYVGKGNEVYIYFKKPTN